jgi:predicted PurR-regulated permease PerM
MNSHEEYDEKEYAPVINHLKSLKKVNAPVNFEDDLKKQIKHVLSKDRKSIFNKFVRKNLFFSSTMYLSLFTLMLILVIFLFVYFFLLRSGSFKQNGSTQKDRQKTEQVRAPEIIPKK